MSISKTFQDASEEEIRYMQGRHSGEIKSMVTPWKRLNSAGIDGLEWGTVNLVAAMSGVGKTALINRLVFACHDLNPTQTICILFFTVEMVARRLVARMISCEMSIPVKDLYKKGDAETIKYIRDKIYPKYRDKDIKYIEGMYSVRRIVQIIQKFCGSRLDKQCLVAYDHSLLMRKTPGKTERQTLVDFGMELLMLKKQFPSSLYIIISQLNRDIERPERIKVKTMQYPQKSDIFGGDALWHASDVVMAIHDPFRLNILKYGPREYPTTGLLFCHLLKVREGGPGLFVLRNETRINKFPELSRTELTQYGFDKKKTM